MTQTDFNGLLDVMRLDEDDKIASALKKSETEDKVNAFLSLFLTYIQNEEPAKKYRKLFSKKSQSEIARFMADVKNTYRIMVLNGDWSERKLVEMIDLAVDHRRDINQYTLSALDQMKSRTKKPTQRTRSVKTRSTSGVSPESHSTSPRNRRRKVS